MIAPTRQLRRTGTRSRARRAQFDHLETRCLLSGSTPFEIVGMNPANGSVVPYLPNGAPSLPVTQGQIVITLSEPVAGLTDGQSPLQSSGTFNPYDVTVTPRGPSGVFSAPSEGGQYPIPATVTYHVNSNGTSEFVIQIPTFFGLANDVYLVHVDLAAFKDAAGNTLTDPNNGYSTFLLHATTGNHAALMVTGVTADNGQTTIGNNIVVMPDTIQIHFNRTLSISAAQGTNVELIANPGPNYSIVPSVATYNPSSDSIFLTPTATLSSGVVYAVRVAGQDTDKTYVSDDEGYGGPGVPLAHTFYDTFEVVGGDTIPAPISPFQVSGDPSWASYEYVSISLNDSLDVSSLGRNSAVLIAASGEGTSSNFGAGALPLNAVTAYNPNTRQLIIVPDEYFEGDGYLLSLSGLKATNGDQLLNNSGQPAGINGNPAYYKLFSVQFVMPGDARSFQLPMSGLAQSASIVPAAHAAAAADAMLTTIPDPSSTSSSGSSKLVPGGPLGG